MKRQWCSVLIAFVLLSVIPSIAQCGMYTYQDVTGDDSGNAIGDNLVQATSCQQSSTYAEGHFTMPSGAQFAATAYGADIAEAVAQAPFANESGNGSFSGNNNTSSDYCGYYNGSTFSIGLAIKQTYGANTLGNQVVSDTKFCGYTPACTNGVIPVCGSPSYERVISPASRSCSYYIRTSFLKVGPACFGANFDAVGPGPCDP